MKSVSVRTQVRDRVLYQVRHQVRAQVRDQVEDQVMDQVTYQVGAQVRDQVWLQVRAQVEDQVRRQVRAQVWDQVRDINKISLERYFLTKKEVVKMLQWVKNRVKERTSWDGGALIAVGVVGLFLSAVIPMNLVCWAAIAWGVVTILKSQ